MCSRPLFLPSLTLLLSVYLPLPFLLLLSFLIGLFFISYSSHYLDHSVSSSRSNDTRVLGMPIDGRHETLMSRLNVTLTARALSKIPNLIRRRSVRDRRYSSILLLFSLSHFSLALSHSLSLSSLTLSLTLLSLLLSLSPLPECCHCQSRHQSSYQRRD